MNTILKANELLNITLTPSSLTKGIFGKTIVSSSTSLVNNIISTRYEHSLNINSTKTSTSKNNVNTLNINEPFKKKASTSVAYNITNSNRNSQKNANIDTNSTSSQSTKKPDLINETSLKMNHITSSLPTRPGIVFDIDGVMVKGKHTLPETVKTLRLLEHLKIPFIFLTNGGGVTERQKAADLTKRFGIFIHEEQVVLGHSPMKLIADKYKDDIVLLIGPDTSKEVAKCYGFKRPILTKEVVTWKPSIWPFKGQELAANGCPYDLDNEAISAILMISDSPTWGKDIQIACDILRSVDGHIGTLQTPFKKQAIPCYFAAADLLWSNDFPISRFGQGAFKIALNTLFKELTGRDVEIEQYGKPETKTYDFSKIALENFSKKFYGHSINHIYAVGDNPPVDIRGANNYGWHSILVRTGVFKNGDNDKQDPAEIVVNNVFDSVQYVLSQERILYKQ